MKSWRLITNKVFRKLEKKPVRQDITQGVVLLLIAGTLVVMTPPIPDSIGIFFIAISAVFLLVLIAWFMRKSFVAVDPKINKFLKKRRDRRISTKASKGEPIRVGFICDSPAYWLSFRDLYYLIKDDPRFDVKIIALPEMQNGKMTNFKIADYFDHEGINYKNGHSGQSSKKIGSLELDYIFPCRPYDHVRPKNGTNRILSRHSKLCHITYGTCIFNGKTLDIVCGFHHLRYYDFIFSETKDHTEIYSEKKLEYPETETKIIESGSPKFDYMHYQDFTSLPSTYDQVVLYTPRWTTTDGSCSFLLMYEQLFTLAEENVNIKYIFRPHPLMKKHFVGDEIWSENEWDNFLARFDELNNAEIDTNPDYLPSFKEATVLISDLSSLLPEFLLTGKPVIYYHQKMQFNTFGDHIGEGYYWCTNWDEIKNVLGSLLKGNDPREATRKEIIDMYFLFGEKTSVEVIRDVLLDDYFASNLDLQKLSSRGE